MNPIMGKRIIVLETVGVSFEDPLHKWIGAATQALIDDLLLERLSMASIAQSKVLDLWLHQRQMQRP